MPDEQAGKMVASFCQQYGYHPEMQGFDKEGQPQRDKDGNFVMVENPVSPMEFTFQQVVSFISQVIDAHRVWGFNQKIPDLVAEDKKKFGELDISITSESLTTEE